MEKDPTKNPSLVGSGRRSHHIGVRIMEKDPTKKNLLTVKGLVGSGSGIGAPQNTHHTSKRMDFRERPIKAHAAAPNQKKPRGRARIKTHPFFVLPKEGARALRAVSPSCQ